MSSAGTQLRAEERAAGEVVAGRLGGGRLVPRDVLGVERTHDLDVEGVPGVGRIALEVTSEREPAMLSMQTAAAKRREAPTLHTDWYISFSSSKVVNVADMVRGLERELCVLEEHGVSRLAADDANEFPAPVAKVHGSIHDRGITTVLALGAPDDGAPAQLILGSHRGLTASAGQVNVIVAERARRKVEKLRNAEADQRHLFVWIDASAPELAMFTEPPPDTTPELPEGIDAVWAATRGKQPGRLCERLWLLRRGKQWEQVAL